MASAPPSQPHDGLAEALRRGPRSHKASERVAQALIRYIAMNGLPEGAQLPKEREMVAEFGVARSTVREALRLLESRGMIRIRPGQGGGPTVRHPTAETVGQALHLVVLFQGGGFGDILEARAALEPLIAGMAAERVTEAEVRDLRRTVAEIRQHAEDHQLFIRENRRFHELVARHSGNVVLRTIVEALIAATEERMREGEGRYTTRRRQRIADLHDAIIEALVAGDADAAEAAMRRHVDDMVKFRQSFRHRAVGPTVDL